MRVREVIGAFWDSLFGGPFDSSEEEIRAREDETLEGIRARRAQVRYALAAQNEREAREKRQQANIVDHVDIRRELIAEAKQKEKQARALREGEISLLNAFGVADEDY